MSLKAGNDYYKQGLYEEALREYEKIDRDSVLYKQAEFNIEHTKRRINTEGLKQHQSLSLTSNETQVSSNDLSLTSSNNIASLPSNSFNHAPNNSTSQLTSNDLTSDNSLQSASSNSLTSISSNDSTSVLLNSLNQTSSNSLSLESNNPSPSVSVIIPVYNVEPYLGQCLDSIINQTLKDIEIICIDDGSTDNSLNILNEYADKDKRFTVLRQTNSGASVARNNGIKIAKGEYIHFMDSDDWIDLNYCEILYTEAKKENADLVRSSYKYISFNHVEEDSFWKGLFDKKSKNKDSFALNVNEHSVVIWNAIYKKSYLFDNNIQYFDKKYYYCEDILFTAKATFFSKKSIAVNGCHYYYRKGAEQQLSAKTNDDIKSKIEAFLYFQKHTLNFISSVKYNTHNDYATAYKRCLWRYDITFCQSIRFNNFFDDIQHKFFDSFLEGFNNFKQKDLLENEPYYKYMLENDFCSYVEFAKQRAGLNNIIISLTSYPDRINSVHKTIATLLEQSYRASKTILWLSIEEFPNKEKDLPKELLELTGKGLLINWCKDIKSYKKLIFALETYPNNIIVTADDDVYYPKDWLEKLYLAYQKQPNMVHCHRAHEIVFKNGKICSYNNWKQRVANIEPSFLTFFTGVGGVLYPPNIFYKDILRDDLFMKLCPKADDIWFWAMCVMNNVKINVVKDPKRHLSNVENTQNKALWHENVVQNNNDIYLKNLFEHYPKLFKKLRIYYFKKSIKKTFRKIFFSDDSFQIDSNQNSRSQQEIITPKISIIIEVINIKEENLRQCLNSVLNQTIKQIEIFINTSNNAHDSFKVINEYAVKDKRIKMLTQQSQSQLIESGIIKSEYILFLNGSMHYENNLCEDMLKAIDDEWTSKVVNWKKYTLSDILYNIDTIGNMYDFLKKYNLLQNNIFNLFWMFKKKILFTFSYTGIAWEKPFFEQIQKVIDKIGIHNWYDDSLNIFCKAIKKGNYSIAANILQNIIGDGMKYRRIWIGQEQPQPAFSQNNTPIVFSSDDNYVKYLSVAIKSVIETSSQNNNYDIIILTEKISDNNKRKLLSMINKYSNFSIRFFYMNNIMSKSECKNIATVNGKTLAAYYRIFVGSIFRHYDKVIYLDADVVVNTDIVNLLQTDIKDKTVGAVVDGNLAIFLKKKNRWYEFQNYANNILGISDLSTYFNSGVLLLNITQIRHRQYAAKLLEVAQINSDFFNDQNVLNSVFNNDKFLLDRSWNCLHDGRNQSVWTYATIDECKIIHYCGNAWSHPHCILSDIWWRYAKMTPFYEEILYLNIKDRHKREEEKRNNAK